MPQMVRLIQHVATATTLVNLRRSPNPTIVGGPDVFRATNRFGQGERLFDGVGDYRTGSSSCRLWPRHHR